MYEKDEGPKSQLMRYAYGYSDRKPKIWREIIVPILMLVAACGVIGWATGRGPWW